MRFIRLPTLTEKIGLQKTAIYKLIAAGEFPPPIKLGRASGWDEDEVEAWMAKLRDKMRDHSSASKRWHVEMRELMARGQVKARPSK